MHTKKEHNAVYHFPAEGQKKSHQVLYSTNYIPLTYFFLSFCFCHLDYDAWSLFSVDF